MSNLQSNQQNSTMSSVITDEEFKTFIGKNADRYLAQFKKFTVGGVDRFKATWHWPAFFVPFLWMPHRKLYLWALALWALDLLLVFASVWALGLLLVSASAGFGVILYFVVAFLLVMVVPGITGNYIYYKHVKKKLFQLKGLHPTFTIQRVLEVTLIRSDNVATGLGILLIVGVLAAISIPGYLNMAGRSWRNAMRRATESAEPELQAWLNSSMKKNKNAALREIDTNGDGIINENDMPNKELSTAGVCKTYAAAQKAMEMKSPWEGIGDLWTTGAGKGQISCIQSGNNITLTARDKEGNVLP